MNPSPLSKKDIIASIVFSLIIIFLIIIFQINDRQTKIVFCDVGQGDSSYIRIKNKIDVLIDAGSDKSVLNCLGKHMPFYDRKIELVIISHLQKDHYGGLFYLLDRYKIDKLMANSLDNSNQSFNKIKKKILAKKIVVTAPTKNMQLKLIDDSIKFYWSNNRCIKNSNDCSFVFLFEENRFRVLYTGDASPFVLSRLLKQSIPHIDILKVPHHGSKNGLIFNFLKLANPTIGVISVGKNNIYGHPAKDILAMLEALAVKIRRTDEEGDIVFRL